MSLWTNAVFSTGKSHKRPGKSYGFPLTRERLILNDDSRGFHIDITHFFNIALFLTLLEHRAWCWNRKTPRSFEVSSVSIWDSSLPLVEHMLEQTFLELWRHGFGLQLFRWILLVYEMFLQVLDYGWVSIICSHSTLEVYNTNKLGKIFFSIKNSGQVDNSWILIQGSFRALCPKTISEIIYWRTTYALCCNIYIIS